MADGTVEDMNTAFPLVQQARELAAPSNTAIPLQRRKDELLGNNAAGITPDSTRAFESAKHARTACELAFYAVMFFAAASPVDRSATAGGLWDGSDSYATGGNVLGFEEDQSVAWSFWYKALEQNPATAMGLLTKTQSGGNLNGYRLLIRGDLTNDPMEVWLRRNSSTFLRVSFPRPNDTQWHHVAVTYDGTASASGVDAWVDGLPQSVSVLSDSLVPSITNDRPFNIGGINNVAQYRLEGALGEVAMWIDLDIPEFVAAVPELAAGARPPVLSAIRNEIVLFQPMRESLSQWDDSGPTLTNFNVDFDRDEHPPVFYPQLRRHFERRAR